jgi:hypothetical protein
MNWGTDRVRLSEALEAAGYDVACRDASLPEGGGSLSARRDRADGTVVVALDAGGRFRATITETLTESASARTVAGVTLRVQTQVSRATTVFGAFVDATQFSALLAVLDDLLARLPDAPAAHDDDRTEPGGPW